MPTTRLLPIALGALVLAGCVPATHDMREDGRFTLGVDNHRLMYGYPVPYSTSHFVVAVDGRLASNSPRFPKDQVAYIANRVTTEGMGGSARKTVSYDFNGVRITQRLVPVTAALAEVSPGEWGQYYRVEYELENQSGEPRKIGLMMLFDTMIDNNDACQMDADNTRISKETKFDGGRVPSEVLVYREPGNKRETTGSFITDKAKATKPDELYIGAWPEFYRVTWNPEVSNDPYFDSAVLMKWNEKGVAAGETRYVATYYGIKNGGNIQALTEGPGYSQRSATVYFDFGKAELSAEGKQAIDQLISQGEISGAFVEVYADAVGSSTANLALSKKRADAVDAYLKSKGIPSSIIIPKAYGEQYADQQAATTTGGKQEDRKAVIVAYVKE